MKSTKKPLLALIEQNDELQVINFLKKAKISSEDAREALLLAITKDMGEACKLLIPKMKQEALNTINEQGETVLMIAARHGLKEVCVLLISNMSEKALNTINKQGETALMIAAHIGMKKVAMLLMTKMKEEAINAITNNSKTALIIAAHNGSEELCEALALKMSREAINVIDMQGNSALIIAAYVGMKAACEQILKSSPQAIKPFIHKQGAISTWQKDLNIKGEIKDLLSKAIQQPEEKFTKTANALEKAKAEKPPRKTDENSSNSDFGSYLSGEGSDSDDGIS